LPHKDCEFFKRRDAVDAEREQRYFIMNRRYESGTQEIRKGKE
jgi:hypothetical protein